MLFHAEKPINSKNKLGINNIYFDIIFFFSFLNLIFLNEENKHVYKINNKGQIWTKGFIFKAMDITLTYFPF